MTGRKNWRAKAGRDYEWIEDQPRAGFGGQGGGDGGSLPMGAREFRQARERAQHGVCAAPSCGRALVPEPGYEDTWTVEVSEVTGSGYTTRRTVRVCSDACGDRWIDADIEEQRARLLRRHRRHFSPDRVKEPGS